MGEDQRPPRSLGEKLDHLFRTVHPSGRGEYSNEEVARALTTAGGPTISASYLWQLRTGKRDNPTKNHLEALAAFFGVSPSYFFDEAEAAAVEAQLRLLVALRDGPVQTIALRAFGLSPGGLNVVAGVIENIREMEGLHENGSDRPPSRRRGSRKTRGGGTGAGAVRD